MPVLSKNSENAVIRIPLYLSGFQRYNRQKAFNIKHFWRIRSIPKLPSKIAKQPLIHKTRNRFGVMSATWVRIPPSPPQKSSNHAGLLDFSFFVPALKITRFWAVLSKIMERTDSGFIPHFFLRFAPICCRNRPLREAAFHSPSPAPRRVSNCNPDGRKCLPWWKNLNAPASPESA